MMLTDHYSSSTPSARHRDMIDHADRIGTDIVADHVTLIACVNGHVAK